MKYAFISEFAHEHSVALMCKLLGASRSGYYRFRLHIVSARATANVRLLEEIKIVHQASRGIYGSPRIHFELNKKGKPCGRHRVARLMAKDGIAAKSHRRFRVTTRQREGAIASPDLLGREFVTECAHQVWVSDITYIWTTEGWLYLAVILDLFSRTVVGWATSARIDAELVCTAFQRATERYPLRFPLIMHSDRGSQYTSAMFRALLSCQSVLVFQSNGKSCYDNAIAESFFHTIKTEGVNHEQFARRDECHGFLFDYIEVFYNQQRLHSSLGYNTPMQMLQEIINTQAA
ncbi:Putative transposase InsK for insertion sequence element IS150 [Anaerolineae bacterium]|nr:Putative transposase InsK for insertion sequence element IS150 [Anaerolineae bacterium]